MEFISWIIDLSVPENEQQFSLIVDNRIPLYAFEFQLRGPLI